jgi:hypothetical protein
MRKVWRFHRAHAVQDRADFQRWFLQDAAPRIAATSAVEGYAVNIFDRVPNDPTRRFLPPGSPSRAGTLVYDVAEEIWAPEPQAVPIPQGLTDRAARSDQFEVTEHVRLERDGGWCRLGSQEGLKQIPLLVWRKDIPAPRAHALWEAHVATVKRVHPDAQRYVQNWVVRALNDDAPRVDGIGTLYYPSLSAFELTFRGDLEGYRAVQADVGEFIAEIPGRLFATEYLLKVCHTARAPTPARRS